MTVVELRKTNRSVLSRLISIGLSAAFCGLALPAMAQEADDAVAEDEGVLEEVIVTGFRRSLGVALDVKKESVGVVDSIMAEDIADFPDTNLAESLQRIPGVTIDRSNGEGRTITVRGLSGQYTRTLINGMEGRASVGGSTGRGFDFNVFASELFNSIIVQKTAAAELIEGSLGSLVNLNTARAFDYAEGTTMLLGGQMQYNDLSEEWGPRATALYAYHDPDGGFGFSASLAYSEVDQMTATGNSVRWQRGQTFNSVRGVNCADNPTDAGCAEVTDSFHARIPRYGTNALGRERLGMTAGFQWSPTDRTEISLDGMYATYDETQDFKTIEVLFRGNEGGMDVTGYTMENHPDRYGVNNSTVIAMDVDNAWVRSETYHRESESEYQQLSLSFEHDFSDSWSIDGLIGMTENEGVVPRETTLMYDDRDYNGYTYDYSSSTQYPSLIFGGPDVNDGTIFQLTEVRDRPSMVENTFDNALFNVDWNINDAFTLKGGFNYKKFTLFTTQARRDGGVCAKGLYDCGEGEIGAPGTDALTAPFRYPARVGAGSDRTWASPDLRGWVDYFDLYNVPAVLNSGSERAVEEINTAYWVQLDGVHALGDMDFLWNAGVRYVETDQESSGWNSGTWVTVERPKYDDTLPAINAALWVTENVVLRAAWAKTMSRPSLSNLSPGGSVDSFNYEIRYNNPYLDPTRSDNIDFSVEWYFAEEALISLAWFQKDIESFPIRELRTGTFASTGLPTSVIVPTSPASQDLEGTCGMPEGCWEISELLNGPGAKLDGWELAFQAPFSMLGIDKVPVLKNMGIVANYTDVSSNVEYNYSGNVITAPLLNTSDNSYNLTVYYENPSFSARVSWAHRSGYNQSGPNRSGNLWQFVEDSTYVDFSANWIITEHWNLTFEALNLTEEAFDSLVDIDARRRLNYDLTGRNFLLGARYRF